jgi:Holliday junction DNA helicase RuvA
VIAKLAGVVDAVGEGWAVIDVGGVGYLVACSARTLSRFAIGDAVRVLVDTHMREGAVVLYGFADAAEQAWFRLLNGVQGVGGRLALAVLSVLTTDELGRAVLAGDRRALVRADGVGPRLAARIVNELKDRVGGGIGVATAAPTSTAAGDGVPERDAVAALVGLGFGPGEALDAVSRASRRLGGQTAVETLIRAGLAELAPRDHGS